VSNEVAEMARSGVGLRYSRPGKATHRRGTPALRYAALLFALGFLAHNGDHTRRGVGTLTPEVFWAGMAGAVVSVATIALVLAGHRHAPLAAVVGGFSMAIGVAAVHLLPHWSALSDAFPGGRVDALSWAAVLFEVASAATLGVAGLYALRGSEQLRT
jgi:hypothetical protein